MMRTVQPDCPIAPDQLKVTELSKDMIRSLRRIRMNLADCPYCPAYEDCPIIAELNSQVSIAVEEVVQEWNLTETLRQADAL